MSVPLNIFSACVAKHLCSTRGIRDAPGLGHHRSEQAGGVSTVVVHRLQATGVHLLKPDHQDAVGGAVGDQGASHGQTRGSRRTVVVDVVDGNVRETELVEDALTTGTIAVDVAGHALIDVVVVDLGIEHCLDPGLVAQFIVVDFAARLDELGHTHAQDVGGCC